MMHIVTHRVGMSFTWFKDDGRNELIMKWRLCSSSTNRYSPVATLHSSTTWTSTNATVNRASSKYWRPQKVPAVISRPCRRSSSTATTSSLPGRPLHRYSSSCFFVSLQQSSNKTWLKSWRWIPIKCKKERLTWSYMYSMCWLPKVIIKPIYFNLIFYFMNKAT